MNPVTFNEPFKGLFPSEELSVPLILYEKPSLSESLDFHSVFDARTLMFKLPFERCRLFIRGQHSDMKAILNNEKGLVNDSGEHNVLSVFMHLSGFKSLRNWIFVSEMWLVPNANVREGFVIHERLHAFNKDIRQIKEVQSGEQRDSIRKKIAAVIANLCSDFGNPHFYLCKKSPTIPQGKTVHWQKQREHFVFLHKSHTANSKQSIGKKCIEDGSTVDRSAHSRRAHSRLLSSPKFKHKQGQRVWVRSAWCGPKEWTDRSGQIYKIVEKPEESFNPKAVR